MGSSVGGPLVGSPVGSLVGGTGVLGGGGCGVLPPDVGGGELVGGGGDVGVAGRADGGTQSCWPMLSKSFGRQFTLRRVCTVTPAFSARPATESPERVADKVRRTVRELKICMFCLGVKTLAELRGARILKGFVR